MIKVSYATVPGLSHDRSDEKSCEDFISTICHGDFVVMSLCDGAGSAKHARRGAELVSSAVCYYLNRHYFRFKHMKLDNAKKKIAEVAKKAVEKEDGYVTDYNCTLLVIIIRYNEYICIHVGDGLIGCLANNKLSVLSGPSNGEYKNQTYFITEPGVENYIKIKKGKFSGKEFTVFVMSDGTAVSFFQKDELISKAALEQLCLENISLSVEEMNGYLRANLFEVISQYTNDDCSLGMISVL